MWTGFPVSTHGSTTYGTFEFNLEPALNAVPVECMRAGQFDSIGIEKAYANDTYVGIVN